MICALPAIRAGSACPSSQLIGPHHNHGELKALIDLVGKSGALEILLEGAIFSADRALRLGFLTRVVADAEVEREVAEAVKIVEGAPLVARWHKKFIRRLLDATPLSAAEVEEGFAAMGTEDYPARCQRHSWPRASPSSPALRSRQQLGIPVVYPLTSARFDGRKLMFSRLMFLSSVAALLLSAGAAEAQQAGGASISSAHQVQAP